MKRVIFIYLIFISTNLFSQDMNRLSVAMSYGINSIIQDEAIVATEIDGRQSSSIELRYTRIFSKSLNKKKSWGVETGIIWSNHQFLVQEPNEEKSDEIKVVSIPIYARLNFFRYFYGSVGTIISYELNAEDLYYRSMQNGVGIGAELGGEYLLNKNLALQFGAFLRQYNLLPFKQDVSHDAISEFGLKIAMSYYF